MKMERGLQFQKLWVKELLYHEEVFKFPLGLIRW